MRIVLGPSSFHPNLGGIEYLTGALSAALRANGHHTLVITNRWPTELASTEQIEGNDVVRFPMPAPGLRPGALATYPARRSRVRGVLREVMTDFGADVILAIGASWQAVHLQATSAALGIPFVLNLQGETAMDDRQIFQQSYLLRRALARLLKSSNEVTACSHWAADDAAALVRSQRGAIVVPNGVDHEILSTIPDLTRLSDARVLSYGRLVPNKGFDLLIAAVSQLPGVVLEIGGSGPAETHLRVAAAALGDRVHFLGRLDREGVKAALTRARVVVMPSRIEPFGMVALEAMAAARPVVVSNVGGAPEFMKGGVSVEPSDPQPLAEAIAYCLAHPELGVIGRTAAAAYGWPVLAQRWGALLGSVLEGQLNARNAASIRASGGYSS